MSTHTQYKLSFTTGGLLAREASITAPLYLETRDWNHVRSRLLSENTLQTRTVSSSVRVVRELLQRLQTLDDQALQLLIDGTAAERSQLTWIAACRRYALISEFAEEVLREKYLLLITHLDHEDFDRFIRSKALWHEELEGLTETTLKKLRSNLFRMLHEGEMLSKDGRIIPPVLSPRVLELIAESGREEFRYFPVSEVDAQRTDE